jgi:RHS repeat-associated protein
MRTASSIRTQLGRALLPLVIAGCGGGKERAAEPQASQAASLTAAQARTARRAGLINSYLQPTFFEPAANFAVSAADSNVYTTASAINNAGTVAGFTNIGCANGTCGNPSSSFFVPRTGQQTLLPNPWPGHPAMVVDVNEHGDMLGFGGPGSAADGDFLKPLVFRADGSYQILALPTPVWSSTVRIWPHAMNDDAAAGLSTIVGVAVAPYVGALAVWHFDGDTVDAVGPSALPVPAAGFGAGHAGQAVNLDGNTCLSIAPGSDTMPYSGPGLTMMAWVRPDPSMCPGGKRNVVRRSDDWGYRYDTMDMSLVCNADGTAAVTGDVYLGSGVLASALPAGRITLGDWTHVAITSDTFRVRTYVDGVEVADQPTAAGWVPGPSGLAVGCRPGDPSSYFKGAIDEVSIFQNALGPDQIRLFHQDKTSYPRAQAQYVVGRYQNGFFDVVLPPGAPGYDGGTSVAAMNNRGVMAGFLGFQGAPVAAIYDPAAGWTNLNELLPGNSGWDLRYATGINDGDRVVGWGLHDGRHAMFRIDTTTREIVDLGHDWNGGFADPQLYILPSAINSFGHVAGSQYDQWPFWPMRAVVYTDETGLSDLNDLLDPALASAGWELRQATAINDDDEVVGYAYNNVTHLGRGFKARLPSLFAAPEASVTPTLLGTATNSAGATKAIFTYTSTYPTPVSLPYGPSNALSNQSGFMASPAELPPQSFTAEAHAPFVATLAGTQLTWTVGGRGATATLQSPRLTVETAPDGSRRADLPDGTKVNLDTALPPDPTAGAEPQVGAPFVGMLAGELSVSPTGAATYRVPIAIPPGVAGMAPNLSLVYSSQGGDGIAGQGWELAGLSMIHRCPRALTKDGYGRPIVMDDLAQSGPSDGLCLDGQKLFETASGSGQYVTESKDFSQIARLASGAFRVVTKSGETRYYGLQVSSRVTVPRGSLGPAAPPSGDEVAIWQLDRVVDAWGNYYDLQYNLGGNTDFTANGVAVTRIDYTGHLSGGATDVAPFYSISFDYEVRPDVRWTRFGASKIPKRQRLRSITTPRGVYTLGYLNADFVAPSRLKRIDYCVGGTCLGQLEFDWNGTSVSWPESAAYALPSSLPTGTHLRGTQLVDIDGDGRLDLVRFKQPRQLEDPPDWDTWWNSGDGWVERKDWSLPTYLVDVNDRLTGVRFADLDGDGRVDMIRDRVELVCVSTSCFECIYAETPCLSDGHASVSPEVWLNRTTPTGGKWEMHREYENLPAGWGAGAPSGQAPIIDFSHGSSAGVAYYDTVADMDGDGLADLVRVQDNSFGGAGAHAVIDVLLNKGPGVGWAALPTVTLVSTSGYHVEDVNRDGLPDLVSATYHTYDDGTVQADQSIFINKGVTAGAISFQTVTRTAPPGWTNTYTALPHAPAFGDLDGDGFYDAVSYFSLGDTSANPDGTGYKAGVGLADGLGTGFAGQGADAYLQALRRFSPNAPNDLFLPQDFGFALMDVNGDGLADLIRNHANRTVLSTALNQGGGEILINTGETWVDINGASGWTPGAGLHRLPVVPDDLTLDNGSAFIDLNGDGITDLIQEANDKNQNTSKAYLSTYSPPVITKFPNGLAQKTAVDYVGINTSAARLTTPPTYSDSRTLGPGLRYAPLPLRVVSALHADDGMDGTATTKYQYSDLRGSAFGYGPQGFATMTVTDPSGLTTKTTFSQAYPYTSIPVVVERSLNGTLATTSTTYCLDDQDPAGCLANPEPPQKYPPSTSFFVHPVRIVDVSNLRTAFPEVQTPPAIATTTDLRFDAQGNSTRVTVTISGLGDTYVTDTVNEYGAAQSPEQQMGKITRTTVTRQRTVSTDGILDSRAHKTEFEYGTVHGALALIKKKVEPNSAPDTDGTELAPNSFELHTAYDYDQFGNLITATDCASSFASCSPGAPGPAGLPFRTTRVSYDPSVLGVPVRYGPGRFATMTTNAAGHVEYTVYDPLFGSLASRTGPNGVETCYAHDAFGQPTEEIARCNVGTPLVTTIRRHLAPPVTGTGCTTDVCLIPDTPFTRARLVTVLRPPSASPTWTFTDGLGREVVTLSRGFDGGILEADTEYDTLGHVHRRSAPFAQSATPFWTTTIYDPIGRVSHVTQDLADVDGSGAAAQTIIDTTYQGATVHTTRRTGAQSQARDETKNVIGKVVTVSDSVGATMRYRYNADGDLVQTIDNLSNSIFIHYDALGRKRATRDPDLGAWAYAYDGFGELIGQLDAKDQLITMNYDVLGRMVSKTDSSGTAQWVYDAAPGGGLGKLAAMIGAPDARLNGTCAVPYVTAAGGNRAVRSYSYTPLGEIEDETACTDGDTFTTSYQYDAFGRQAVVQYPEVRGSRMAVGYHYTQLGYLHYLTDDSGDYSVHWRATGMNARGQLTRESERNGVETVWNRNPATGWLMSSSSTAHADGDRLIQSWTYRYDGIGNLRGRERSDAVNASPSTEAFTYDPLNRLATSDVTVGSHHASESYDYDTLGNLKHKANNGYTYGACGAGPHAVCTVAGGAPFVYDADGNMTSGGGRNVQYSPSNRPIHVDSPAGAVEFVYGADGNRVVQVAGPPSGGTGATARTVYVGLGATGKSIYERTKTGSTTEHVHFIYAGGAHGGSAFAMRVVTDTGPSSTPTTATKYYHFDHLGSVTAMSDEQGHVTASGADATTFDYDPWGARRSPDGLAGDPASFAPQPGHREFTGHEAIPSVGLVNMNGRIYDPLLGRFLSPDPNIQFAADLQSYNRYSYVLNNPLRYTDPTGYFLGFDFGSDWGIFKTGLALFTLTTCIASPAACTGFLIMQTLMSTTVSIVNGAPFAQTVEASAIGLGVSFASGGIMGGGEGGNLLQAMVNGAISGAVSTAMTNLFTGQPLGRNVLESAESGAVSGAAGFGLHQAVAKLSQASAAEAQGGGGSGEVRVESRVLKWSVAGYKCEGCNASDLDIYPDGPGPLGVPQLRDPINGPGGVMDYLAAGREPGLSSSLQPADAFFLLKAAVGLGMGAVGAVLSSGVDEVGSVSFFEGTSYSAKVLQQLKGAGEFHSFPESVRAFEEVGSVRAIVGGDGNMYRLLEIPGSYSTANGAVYEGAFQFIKDQNGIINHRLFVPTQ